MLPLTPARCIDLMKKFDEWNRVVIVAQRKMAFVFRDSVHIHDANNNKAHGAGYSPFRPFFSHRFYGLLEAFPFQNRHGTFEAERSMIIADDECRDLPAA